MEYDEILIALEDVPFGEVRAIVCQDVPGTLMHLGTSLQRSNDARLLSLSWQGGCSITDSIQSVIEGMAKIALARWPNWYGETVESMTGAVCPDERIRESDFYTHFVKRHNGINIAWLRESGKRCEIDVLPIPAGFAGETQAQQLAYTLADNRLYICFVFEEQDPPPTHLLCFSRVVEWTAKVTGARLLAIIPADLRNRAELDPILFHNVQLLEPHFAKRNEHDEPAKVVVPPLIGVPHPNSPGEQLLARVLRADAELAGLFQFNQQIETGPGERFLVDAFWQEGGFVIEVDGYTWHSTKAMFNSDRNRDYRLLVNGYRVLRLPHDELMRDVSVGIEKVRDVVRYIRKRGLL